MTIIFDGKRFAAKKLAKLDTQVAKLINNGTTPTLASIYYSSDPASVLYTKLKKKTAKSIGIDYLDYEFTSHNVEEISWLIGVLNKDKSVHGILVQKPVGKYAFDHSDWQKITQAIALDKDVDGLREESRFTPATVEAVLEILAEALILVRLSVKEHPLQICVVGSRGMVGRPLVKMLNAKRLKINERYEVFECNSETPQAEKERCFKQANVIISATGKPGLITDDKVKDGVVAIDVGSPVGEFDFDGVKKKASFITPVPGGVGPVTRVCLFENLLLAVGK